MSLTGEAERPLKLYGNQSYCTASLFAVNGILLALRERHHSGKGQYLDISVMECVAATLDHPYPDILPAMLFPEGTADGTGTTLSGSSPVKTGMSRFRYSSTGKRWWN